MLLSGDVAAGSIVIDFDHDAQGNALTAGTLVADQYAGLGLTITGDQELPAMIFDSANPTGDDFDLGTPGNSPLAQGNILILSEDGDSSDPDDAAQGGTLSFNFAEPTTVTRIELLDIDPAESDSRILTFDAQGNALSDVAIPPRGDNQLVTVDLNLGNVSELRVILAGSGAVTGLVYSPTDAPEGFQLQLDDLSDTFPFDDNQTTFATADLSGRADPLAAVELFDQDQNPLAQVAADEAGIFTFASVPLAIGSNVFTAKSGGDIATVTVERIDPLTIDDGETESSLRVAVQGVGLDAFNPTSAAPSFTLAGDPIPADLTDWVLVHNGEFVDLQNLDSDTVRPVDDFQSVEGLNELVLSGIDAEGRSLVADWSYWAGDQELQVVVVDESGDPVAQPATVTVQLGDDTAVSVQATTENGTVTFASLPARTIFVNVNAGDLGVSLVGANGGDGILEVVVSPILPASAIDNNDFSQGLDGWELYDSDVDLVVHEEQVGPNSGSGVPAANEMEPADGDAQASVLDSVPQDLALQSAEAFSTEAAPLALQATAAASLADHDLQLNTSGEGVRRVSRTFTTGAATTAVVVRYRFVTSEIPGGFFGSEFNDFYSVAIRSGSSSTGASGSMNSLGLAAFDANGATAWQEAVLQVQPGGDTIQVDVKVANVADDQFDSQVYVDFIREIQDLKVTADVDRATVNQNVTFTVEGGDPSTPYTWLVDGVPVAGETGASLVRNFKTAGNHSVTAQQDTVVGQSVQVKVLENSGTQWVSRFPTSKSTADLQAGFAGKVNAFISAIRQAGGDVSVNATLRPAERAYLMHHAFRVAEGSIMPAAVPSLKGVDIAWLHYNDDGSSNVAASVNAAKQMVKSYNIAYRPSLTSNHIKGLAIDMSISWSGDLKIKNASGETVTIASGVRNGNNPTLHQVGASYGVKKLVKDPPHWSSTGG